MRSVLISALLLGVAGCASVPGETSRNDPYEGFNRAMLDFNLGLDEAVLEPVSQGYTTVTPQWGRDRVSDFFGNLGEPVTFINAVLQGNGQAAVETAARFGFNTTFGIAGLFDVAGYEGLERHKEDFGQTLAVWGVDSGPYLVLPLLGSTNPRDLVGFTFDRAISPTNYIDYADDSEDETAIRLGMALLNGINARAGAQSQIETLRSQPEPYVALRRTHTAQRDAAIRNGQTDPDAYENLPDFDDY